MQQNSSLESEKKNPKVLKMSNFLNIKLCRPQKIHSANEYNIHTQLETCHIIF